MAQISLIDLLGTDNVALSRTDINKNFQTVENSINTLEGFLNTSPAGGDLSIGNVVIPIGANSIGTYLFTNNASSQILGNLAVGTNFTLTGNASLGNDATIVNKLVLTGDGPSAAVTIGSNANVPFILKNVEFIDEMIATATPIDVETENVGTGTGLYSIASVAGLRAIKLSFPSHTSATTDSANFIELPAGTVGQRLFIQIVDFAGWGTYNVYIRSTSTINGKYSSLTSVAPHNTTASNLIPAFGWSSSTAANEDEVLRQWIEVIYTADGWEVINAHKDIIGL